MQLILKFQNLLIQIFPKIVICYCCCCILLHCNCATLIYHGSDKELRRTQVRSLGGERGGCWGDCQMTSLHCKQRTVCSFAYNISILFAVLIWCIFSVHKRHFTCILHGTATICQECDSLSGWHQVLLYTDPPPLHTFPSKYTFCSFDFVHFCSAQGHTSPFTVWNCVWFPIWLTPGPIIHRPSLLHTYYSCQSLDPPSSLCVADLKTLSGTTMDSASVDWRF